METQQDRDGGAAIEQIIEQLGSRRAAVREEAERRLNAIGADSVPDLLAILVAERGKRRKKQHVLLTIFVIYLILMITAAILSHKFGSLFSIGSMSGVLAAAFAATHTQRRVTRVLTQFEDVRTVGALAEALEYQDQDIAQAAERTLIPLLPKLKASDQELLDAEQRMCLYRGLKRKNADLALAILAALEQVGDGRAVPFVQKLADGEGSAAKDERIRAAALECLPALQERAELERSRETLLRASAATAVAGASDILLRPASGVTPTDTSELLRATATETGNTVERQTDTAANTRENSITAERIWRESQPEIATLTMQQGAPRED